MKNETTINQQIHAALGKGCWHDWKLSTNPVEDGLDVICIHCDEHEASNRPNPAYTTSLDLLWPLVEQICEKGHGFTLCTGFADKHSAGFERFSDKAYLVIKTADTAPMAIALACLAIKAIED